MPAKVQRSLLGYIDILGFGARLLDLQHADAVLAVAEDVAFVQRQFEHKTRDAVTRRSHEIKGKRVLAFSDCIVVSVPLTSRLANYQGDFDVLMAELTQWAWAQGECVPRSIFLRGAADLGLHYQRADRLVSPALARAYQLEQQADVPMIALTESLHDYLSRHPHRQFYDESIDPLASFKRFTLSDNRSFWYLDYMPIFLDVIDDSIRAEDRAAYQAASPEQCEHMRNDAWLRNCARWLRAHGRAILTAHRSASTPSVRAKYEWLAVYHNDSVHAFFAEPPDDTLISLE